MLRFLKRRSFKFKVGGIEKRKNRNITFFCKHRIIAQRNSRYHSKVTPKLEEHLDKIVQRYDWITSQLNNENFPLSPKELAKLGKESSEITEISTIIKRRKKIQYDLIQLEEVLNSANDRELTELALSDKKQSYVDLQDVEMQILLSLLPKDDDDLCNAIVEVRAGTGGQEAQLFALDVFKMYQGYAEQQNWRFETLSLSTTEIGGLREGSASITGEGVYGIMKFESGVHRVQRVPVTETLGRVHTSTMTVAVLPDSEDINIEFKPTDLRIETYRAGGRGGQHVNTTDSAIRITHIPTGIQVAIQDDRSQHRNKAKALKILKARVYEQQREQLHSKRAKDRQSQVGTGDRSERIRTYNFPQDRITDHRVGITLNNMESMLRGEKLSEIHEALQSQKEMEDLKNLQDTFL
eukprot:TRINITY_DN6588_c0_g1_i2.p1 TRINITY_DN6588_c0_g1~~TRINITY_DN6588_c0_g1_i2.p1  ORF type:complete len:409 (-),score=59.62 TRINITY_DN6588_c0_g1_i2:25-1251(-)